MAPHIEGPPETAAPAAANAGTGAKSVGCWGASDTDNNTAGGFIATARKWTVDRFLRVLEVRS